MRAPAFRRAEVAAAALAAARRAGAAARPTLSAHMGCRARMEKRRGKAKRGMTLKVDGVRRPRAFYLFALSLSPSLSSYHSSLVGELRGAGKGTRAICAPYLPASLRKEERRENKEGRARKRKTSTRFSLPLPFFLLFLLSLLCPARTLSAISCPVTSAASGLLPQRSLLLRRA